MKELSCEQINLVSGGEMSTRTKVIIGAALVISPVMGAGLVLGYYVNIR